MSKVRLDKLLVDRGQAASRERAQALILAGRVLVEGQRTDKPGTPVPTDSVLRLLGDDLRYVSRGGLKLERALTHWPILLGGVRCVDVGASTGGFTDCMLQHGAAEVYAVDTGYGQISQKLRSDPRVRLFERTNARLLEPGDLAKDTAGASVGFVAMDVSFISATLVLGPVLRSLVPAGSSWAGEMVLLIKPQFEAGREFVGKGGIVRDPRGHELAIARVTQAVTEQGGKHVEIIDSPIKGMEGNVEFLLHAVFGGPSGVAEDDAEAPVH